MWNQAMKLRRMMAPLAVVLAAAAPAFAQTGDECTDPFTNADLVVGVGTGTTADNTGSTGDDTSCGFSDEIDEWWRITANCTGTLQASLCGSSYDTTISAFDACPAGSELACNDDSCGLQSEISFAVTSGTDYWIRISGFNNGTGDYTLEVLCDGAPVPVELMSFEVE